MIKDKPGITWDKSDHKDESTNGNTTDNRDNLDIMDTILWLKTNLV
jgi:hypothetical protein